MAGPGWTARSVPERDRAKGPGETAKGAEGVPAGPSCWYGTARYASQTSPVRIVCLSLFFSSKPASCAIESRPSTSRLEMIYSRRRS